ncbi:MAG TPA: sigma factor [Gemmataceae bacterium]|nr:sigma factor [Gemmataceae bacterium]
MFVTSSTTSNDPTVMAACALDTNLPEDLREQARRSLVPVIRRIACRVAADAGQAGRDLLDEAISHVLCRLDHFKTTQGHFVGWCRRVLTNRLIDLIRRDERHRADQLHPEGREDVSAGLDLRAFEVAADLEAPFSAADLARICAWKPADRLVLLSLGLLWRKVPAVTWWQTVAACGLRSPFPLAGFGEGDTREERGDVLAAALGWTRNRLSTRMSRGRHLLGDLDFVRDIQGK